MMTKKSTVFHMVIMMSALHVISSHSLVPTCQLHDQQQSQPYCQCLQNNTRSGRTINISCDFHIKGIKEDVLLTDALFPFRRRNVVSAYVRIMNAGRLQVTQNFLQEWLTVPSAALDIWHSGTVTLEASPPLDNYRFLASFSTFVGIGIIGCSVPEIPHQFLRDRMVASLRIKNSVVNIMRRGFLHNIHQVRYLVLEDSVVDTVEGPVATEGHMTLGRRLGHTWNGLIISKTVIRTLGAGAFNLTHEGKQSDDTCKADVTNCRLGTVGTGAMTVSGNIAVTIKGNHFQRLERKAFNIDVKNELKFEENVALSLDVSALEGLICHNLTSLEKNTAYLDKIPNDTVIPFHMSCGNPQVFMVVSAAKPEVVHVTSKATWVLLAILLLLVVAALLYCYGLSQRKCQYRKGNTFHFFNGLMSSEERLCSGPEVNVMNEVPVEGLSNPLYERREPTSSL